MRKHVAFKEHLIPAFKQLVILVTLVAFIFPFLAISQSSRFCRATPYETLFFAGHMHVPIACTSPPQTLNGPHQIVKAAPTPQTCVWPLGPNPIAQEPEAHTSATRAKHKLAWSMQWHVCRGAWSSASTRQPFTIQPIFNTILCLFSHNKLDIWSS